MRSVRDPQRPKRLRERAKALDIAEQAEAFFMACRVLRRLARQKAHTMADIPMVVNAALALELYLKSLLTLEKRKFRWIHDPAKLFEGLSDQTKRRLIREHKKWEKNEIFERLIAGGTTPDILTLLHLGRNSFQSFRYRYENRTDGTIWGLDVCLSLVRNLVMKKLNIEPHPAFVRQHADQPGD